jgi:hypothetical protein
MQPAAYQENTLTGLTLFFTGEVILRFVIAPKRQKFFQEAYNIYDLLAILPFYLNKVLKL